MNILEDGPNARLLEQYLLTNIPPGKQNYLHLPSIDVTVYRQILIRQRIEIDYNENKTLSIISYFPVTFFPGFL